LTAGNNGNTPSSSAGIILYRPAGRRRQEVISSDNEAWRILSHDCSGEKDGNAPQIDLSAVCARWKELLDRNRGVENSPRESDVPENGFIDTFPCGRRLYGIKVTALCDRWPVPSSQELYLFTLERLTSFEKKLSIVSRKFKLSKRECDLIVYLVNGCCNKEIADSLGLSINTAKGYMKLLSRKLGVNNRVGIISVVDGLK
jgi:DNA-binding CsgD family transcriptional regulator